MSDRDRRIDTLLKPSRFRHRIALFILAVAVAGAALVVFAVREADQERFAWRQERHLRLEQTATLVADKTLSSLSDLVIRLSTGYRSGTGAEPVLSPSEKALAAELFVIKSGGSPRFPLFRPPFRLGKPVLPPEDQAAKSPALRAAEEQEFVRKDFGEASKAYRAALASATTPSQRAMMMIGLGRSLAKAGRPGDALDVYRRLVRENERERLEDGLPAGLIGRFAFAHLAASRGLSEDAAGTLLDLLERLIDGVFDIDKGQYLSFAGLAEERFAETLSRISPGEGRRTLESRKGSLRTRGQETLDRAERAEWIALNPSVFQNKKEAFWFLPINSGRYLVGSIAVSENETFGAVFDARQVRDRMVPGIVRSMALEEGLRIDLSSGDLAETGTNLPAEFSDLSVERPLAADLPQWTIRAWLDPVASLPGFGTRKAIYVALALILIGAALTVGLVTIRSMAREMEIVRMKSDFVATVSHELRTPLTSIRYISELLKDGRVAEEGRKNQYYGTLYAESERLGRIIENILDVSKIDAGLKEYHFVRIEAGPLTAAISERFRKMIAPKGFVLTTEISADLPELSADPEALERALLNLLDNAAKYSGGSRNLDMRVHSSTGRVRWEVVDHGVGISKEDQLRIFERFYRSRSGVAPDIKGSGIGLTIAKHIIEAHGGTLSVESELGQGSTFVIDIPIGRRPEDVNA